MVGVKISTDHRGVVELHWFSWQSVAEAMLFFSSSTHNDVSFYQI